MTPGQILFGVWRAKTLEDGYSQETIHQWSGVSMKAQARWEKIASEFLAEAAKLELI